MPAILHKMIALICIIISVRLHAQDSIQVLTCEEFFVLIESNHPVARQASLLPESARYEIRSVRGVFDPKLNAEFYQKEYLSKEYYTLSDNYLRIPTWVGIDIKAGYERNTGDFVNGEHLTPEAGLTYLGLSVPIGQGMIIDERRAQLRQAQQLKQIAEAEKIKLINKLLLQAAKDYWDWMFYYNKLILVQQSFDAASLRYEGIKTRAENGDLAAIDTTEAAVQVQNFRIMLAAANVEYSNASIIVSNYLWTEDGFPLEITPKLIPSEHAGVSPLMTEQVETLVERAATHPEMLKLDAKIKQLETERMLRADKFKPKLSIEYNVLRQGFPGSGNTLSFPYMSDNYKFGATVSYPLFLRQERGKMQLTKIKIQEANFERMQANREITNRIRTSINEWQAAELQVKLQKELVKSMEVLTEAERIRFENGESSVFLINTRELALITSELKLYELKAKAAKSAAHVQWSVGSMTQ